MSRDDTGMSKLLSLVLRHRPELVGISLDDAGWTPVDDLLAALDRFGEPLSLTALEEIVAGSGKQRFALSPDRARIRANQGHSVAVDLGLEQATPPDVLYHGTAHRCLDAILRDGLDRRGRHHVHLHADLATARTVGARHGNVVVLAVDAAAMHDDGLVFYVSENRVWLTEAVPPGYLAVLER